VPLSRSDITVSNLVFHHVAGTETQAVRIDLTLQKSVRNATISKQYRTFVVLDAS